MYSGVPIARVPVPAPGAGSPRSGRTAPGRAAGQAAAGLDRARAGSGPGARPPGVRGQPADVRGQPADVRGQAPGGAGSTRSAGGAVVAAGEVPAHHAPAAASRSGRGARQPGVGPGRAAGTLRGATARAGGLLGPGPGQGGRAGPTGCARRTGSAPAAQAQGRWRTPGGGCVARRAWRVAGARGGAPAIGGMRHCEPGSGPARTCRTTGPGITRGGCCPAPGWACGTGSGPGAPAGPGTAGAGAGARAWCCPATGTVGC